MNKKLNILMLNGPNLNLLGTREKNTYGTTTLKELIILLNKKALSLKINIYHYQSNAEHEISEKIHESKKKLIILLLIQQRLHIQALLLEMLF